jgi:hypothetical protein
VHAHYLTPSEAMQRTLAVKTIGTLNVAPTATPLIGG